MQDKIDNKLLYKRLFNESNDAIFMHDLKGKIIDVNRKAIKLFGYTRSRFLKLNIADLHPTSEHEKSKQAFRTVSKEGRVRFEALFKKKDHSLFSGQVSASLFKVGDLPIVQGIVRDISKTKRIESELRASEEKLRGLFDSMDEMVFSFDTDGRFTFYHAPERSLLYAHPKEFMGRKASEVLPKEIVKKIEEAFVENSRGRIFEFEYPMRLKDRTVWFSAKVSPIIDRGTYTGSISIIREITAKKEAEQAKDRELTELQRIDEMKSSILRDVSHELKTPISVVTQATKLIKEELCREFPDTARIAKYSEIAHRNSIMFRRHIETILEFSRLKELRKIEKKKIFIFGIVKDTLSEIAPEAQKKGIKIKQKLGLKCTITGNPALLKNLFKNILDNAIKFTDKGTVNISCRAMKHSFRITVEDTGIGIPKRQLNKVFEPFFQADSSVEGLGIGLSIAKQIVDIHGGHMKIESRVGKGTKISIFFPR
ncbi:TPA: PAS domain S-box protein [Candidatus Woesearchaeota archaeon]|nr:PAS domain S-box protein [Candidatus Woesearchaeota archaeon]